MSIENNLQRIADLLEKGVSLMERGLELRQAIVSSIPEAEAPAPEPEKAAPVKEPKPKVQKEEPVKESEPEAVEPDPVEEPKIEAKKDDAPAATHDDIRVFVRTGYKEESRKADRKESFQKLLGEYSISNIDQLEGPNVCKFLAELKTAFA